MTELLGQALYDRAGMGVSHKMEWVVKTGSSHLSQDSEISGQPPRRGSPGHIPILQHEAQDIE